MLTAWKSKKYEYDRESKEGMAKAVLPAHASEMLPLKSLSLKADAT